MKIFDTFLFFNELDLLEIRRVLPTMDIFDVPVVCKLKKGNG